MLKRITYLTVILAWIIFPVQSHSQVTDRLHFERFLVEDGLPSHWARDITQDKDGYLWFATEAGLARYDGYSFKTFSHVRDDSTSLSSDNLSKIITDQKGTIWIAAINALNRYDSDHNQFIRYVHDPQDSTSLPSGIISSLYQTRNGTLWVGMDTGELASMNIATGRFTHYPLDRSRYIQNALGTFNVSGLTEDSAGRLYVGIAGGGIHVLDSETGESLDHWVNDPLDPESIPNNIITTLFIDRDDVLWVGYRARMVTDLNAPPIGSESGLFRRFLKTGETRIYTYQGGRQPAWWVLLSDIYQTRDGVVWISNSAGNVMSLARYLPAKDSFQIYTYEAGNPNSLPWSYVSTIFEDEDGIMWVGTSRGLGKSDRSRLQMDAFTMVPGDPFQLENLHYGILEVRDNVFWFNNDGLNSYEWDRNTGDTRTLPFEGSLLMPNNRGTNTGRQAGVFDGKHTVWFNSSDNMFSSIDVVTLKTTPLFPVSPNFQTSTLLALVWMPDSTIWISSSEGVKQYDPVAKNVTSVDVNTTLHFIHTGPTGTVWAMDVFGLLDSTANLRGNLLGRMDLNKKLFRPVAITDQYLENFAQGIVATLIEARDGTIWVGRNDGLLRYVPSSETFTMFDKSKGLSYYNVNNIIEDAAGYLWITTQHGISRFDPKTERFRHFEKEDGLRPFRMNRGSMLLRKNGEIMFGGVGGVNIFHPASIRDFSTVPRILITDVNVGGKSRAINAEISIDWDDNEVNIEYVSINFRSPERTTYSYKLEGYHNDWVEAGTRRLIQFTNLPPGPYTLLVKAMNAEGLESEVPASLSIRILPPWWRTWWAYGFYVMMFAGMVFGVDRTQRRRLIQKERERTRELELAQAKEIEQAYKNLEVAHDNLIAAQTQLIQQEKLASLGQLTAGIAHEIKNPLNFVNNFSSVSLEMIDEVLDEVEKIKGGRAEVKGGDPAPDVALALVSDILSDIKINLKKIHEHGSRADGIVKSMLQHSRGGTGKMEPTDLNALVTEFVNLSYHGMRAGSNPVDAEITLDLDSSIGEVPLVYEDFSRVILNICTNAFDAMRMAGIGDQGSVIGEQGGAHLQVRTRREANQITIEIEDNGPGIPDDIKDKILQPFFTTKKGTQGTGLGLSITHDIIKAHGGELAIQSQPGKTTFSLTLLC
jgi:signal transduction histidine kinase/ligand-binding sensor domain-containing protein